MTVALLALSLTACVNDSPQTPGTANPAEPGRPPPGADQVESNVAKGRVTTRDGRPLSGIEVGADNTFSYGSYLYGVSDQDGYYRIDLSDAPNTTWKMFGSIEVPYEGQTYREDLWVDATAFSTEQGAIRNFEWRLDGPRPGFDDYYYGGTAYLHEGYYEYDWETDPEPTSIEDMDWVEVTFEPTAPLIDGSQGQTIVRQDGYEATNIPIGKYRVSARYLPPGGQPVNLLIRHTFSEDQHQASVELVFDSNGEMRIEILHPQ